MKRPLAPILFLILACSLLAGRATAQPANLGKVEFPNGGAEAAQAPFLRGLLLLHSFEYDDAEEAFREARTLDPDFAMAAWGEALTHTHPLWGQQDLEAGRAALASLGADPAARLAKAPSEREKAYLRAVHLLYGEGEREARADAYAAAMQRVTATYPDDLEAQSFYALALLGTTWGERDVPTYMRAAAVAEEVFDANPRHPGAAHYLIHSYDDPIHAPLGLRPARLYAGIAPAAAHALHMPSHIFLALGMWEDVVASNEVSWAASEERVARKGLGNAARGYHALSWLAYAFLQQGRYDDARRLLGDMAEDVTETDARHLRSYLVRMRAAHLVETRLFDDPAADLDVDLADLSIGIAATDLFADGLWALGRADGEGAEAALQALHEGIAAVTDEDRRRQPSDVLAAEVMARELDALIRFETGDRAAALALMAEATQKEESMSFGFGPAFPAKPSHELFGEMLLADGQPEAARAAFQQSLDRSPGRVLSMLGLARAAAETGDAEKAQQVYGELQAIWHRADAGLPERAEVTSMLGSKSE